MLIPLVMSLVMRISYAIKNHKAKNNNKKPRIIFKEGLLKQVGPWAAEFGSEVARICRMNAPLSCRRWRKVASKDKKTIHDRILESFDVDLHILHVKRAVNRFLGQRLRAFRSKLYKHYKNIADGLEKTQYPHEDVQQHDWVGMCSWFETDEFKSLSEMNSNNRSKHKINHCCGSKPFVRHRDEMLKRMSRKDPETQQEPGKVAMYQHTHFNKKKGRWVAPEAEDTYNAMKTLQSDPVPADSTPMTEDQVYDKIVGVRPGYAHGLGHGQDPVLASSLDGYDNTEDIRRRAEEAGRCAEEAERRVEETERRFQEAERRLHESERRTDEKLQAMEAQMMNFMALCRGSNPC